MQYLKKEANNEVYLHAHNTIKMIVNTIKIRSSHIFAIAPKTWEMKLTFWLQINTKIFYKLVISLWVCVTCHSQITLNNKFTISLQYLKENKGEIDVLPVD